MRGTRCLPAVEKDKLRTKSSIHHVAAVQRLQSQDDTCCQVSYHVLRDGPLLFQQRAASQATQDRAKQSRTEHNIKTEKNKKENRWFKLISNQIKSDHCDHSSNPGAAAAATATSAATATAWYARENRRRYPYNFMRYDGGGDGRFGTFF